VTDQNLTAAPRPDDAEQVAEFEARIARGESIEPKDWMPDRYRKQLVRMMSQHAHSEIVGMLPEGQLDHACAEPAPQDGPARQGAGRGRSWALHLLRYRDARRRPARSSVDQLLTGKAKYSSIFNYPTLTWADIGVIGWFVDGAAIVNQTMLAKASFGPYARAMVRVCKEKTSTRSRATRASPRWRTVRRRSARWCRTP
jgi:ring-1,2-phenylacetyl-CoA epoxidase subunit PaaA